MLCSQNCNLFERNFKKIKRRFKRLCIFRKFFKKPVILYNNFPNNNDLYSDYVKVELEDTYYIVDVKECDPFEIYLSNKIKIDDFYEIGYCLLFLENIFSNVARFKDMIKIYNLMFGIKYSKICQEIWNKISLCELPDTRLLILIFCSIEKQYIEKIENYSEYINMSKKEILDFIDLKLFENKEEYVSSLLLINYIILNKYYDDEELKYKTYILYAHISKTIYKSK